MTVKFLETMPKIIGHRGACGLAPENTLASFDAAAKSGAKSVEIDVMTTKDEQCVICHDTNLKRCTDGEGQVLLKTLEEIQALDAGSWFDASYSDQKIPTLSQALNNIRGNGMSVNLEIKPTDGWQVPTAQIVGKELGKTLPDDLPVLLSSFNIEALTTIGELLPDLPRGYLSDAIPHNWEVRLAEARASSLHCYKDYVTEDVVKAVQDAGYKFLVFTVNDPEHARQLLSWNVDAIITDFPDRMQGLA